MSQEPAIKGSTDQNIDLLFEELKLVLLSTRPGEDFFDPEILEQTIDKCRAAFAEDEQRMAAYTEVLYGEDYDTFGEKTTAIFSEWEEAGGGPILPAMVASAIREFNLDMNKPLVKASLLAAIMAEYPNELQYHGNEHYRKVLFHVLRLMSVHNAMFDGTNRKLTNPHIAILLIGACVHDLGHEGGDNLRDGMYTPGHMEQFAMNLSRPYFEELGVDSDSFGELETIVFCTDITFFAGDNSPCVRMKKIYRHYFWDDDREDVSMMMMGKLRRFEDNPRLSLMAMILHEADVATSAGLSYEQTIKETIAIMEERGLKIAGPKTVLAFLREQLGETMFSEASKRLYGRVMIEVIRHAEADIERGRETFYED